MNTTTRKFGRERNWAKTRGSKSILCSFQNTNISPFLSLTSVCSLIKSMFLNFGHFQPHVLILKKVLIKKKSVFDFQLSAISQVHVRETTSSPCFSSWVRRAVEKISRKPPLARGNSGEKTSAHVPPFDKWTNSRRKTVTAHARNLSYVHLTQKQDGQTNNIL